VILRALMDGGLALDPTDEPQLAQSLESRWERIPVVLHRL
jgi:hypothetical protein